MMSSLGRIALISALAGCSLLYDPAGLGGDSSLDSGPDAPEVDSRADDADDIRDSSPACDCDALSAEVMDDSVRVSGVDPLCSNLRVRTAREPLYRSEWAGVEGTTSLAVPPSNIFPRDDVFTVRFAGDCDREIELVAPGSHVLAELEPAGAISVDVANGGQVAWTVGPINSPTVRVFRGAPCILEGDPTNSLAAEIARCTVDLGPGAFPQLSSDGLMVAFAVMTDGTMMWDVREVGGPPGKSLEGLWATPFPAADLSGTAETTYRFVFVVPPGGEGLAGLHQIVWSTRAELMDTEPEPVSGACEYRDGETFAQVNVTPHGLGTREHCGGSRQLFVYDGAGRYRVGGFGPAGAPFVGPAEAVFAVGIVGSVALQSMARMDSLPTEISTRSPDDIVRLAGASDNSRFLLYSTADDRGLPGLHLMDRDADVEHTISSLAEGLPTNVAAGSSLAPNAQFLAYLRAGNTEDPNAGAVRWVGIGPP